MRRKLRVALLAVAVLFGAASATVASQAREAKPASAAVYCSNPLTSCYWTYRICGPFQWNPWIGAWIDKCGTYLY